MNSFILYISLYVFWYPLVMSTFWIIGGILFYYRRERKPALPLGLLAAKGEFLVGLDADAYLDPDALRYMIPHFITPNYGERVGAVTGNPRVRNRSSLLARIQLCEFSSIISLIKRTQRLLGKVMTVSGVVVVFRKSALLDCGLWDRDLITEGIGITWKLQKRFWDIRYEPRAICWMLVPETLVGLWKQRVRWAQGGLEVIIRHWNIFLINNTYYYNYSSYFNMCFCFNVFLGEI